MISRDGMTHFFQICNGECLCLVCDCFFQSTNCLLLQDFSPVQIFKPGADEEKAETARLVMFFFQLIWIQYTEWIQYSERLLYGNLKVNSNTLTVTGIVFGDKISDCKFREKAGQIGRKWNSAVSWNWDLNVLFWNYTTKVFYSQNASRPLCLEHWIKLPQYRMQSCTAQHEGSTIMQ